MKSKLGLDQALVEKARASAARVAEDTQRFIDRHTTVAVERTVCRLLGIDGVNDVGLPLPNAVVDHLCGTHAGRWLDNAPDGIGARFDSDGSFLDVCRYENGTRNGKSVSFDENGNVVIKVWENGELISEQTITDGE